MISYEEFIEMLSEEVAKDNLFSWYDWLNEYVNDEHEAVLTDKGRHLFDFLYEQEEVKLFVLIEQYFSYSYTLSENDSRNFLTGLDMNWCIRNQIGHWTFNGKTIYFHNEEDLFKFYLGWL